MTAATANLHLALLTAGAVLGLGWPATAQTAADPAVPVQSVPVLPVPTQQVPVQPVPVQPVPGQPVPVQPIPVQPIPVQPVPAQPIPAQPIPVQPVPAQPTPAQPVPGAPLPIDPATGLPVAVPPGPGQPIPAEPAPVTPAPVAPAPAEPDPAAPAPGSARPTSAEPRSIAPVRPRPANRAVAPAPAATPADPAAQPHAAGGTSGVNGVFSGADIEAASYAGSGDLPSGRSALTAKVQTLLDRSGVSPGVTDGFKGGMSESAIRAFERKLGLPTDGRMDPEVWAQLQAYATGPVTQNYTITDDDAADLVDSIPTDYAEKAKMARLGYTSIAEKLAERFHMDEKFIAFLNPGVTLAPGVTITVMVPAKPVKGQVTRIIVDKATRRVAAYDASGRLVVDYPATIGSTATPSPTGTHKVEAVALNPNYTYNPNINFKQGDNDKVLTIPPGPNGPVGLVWIDLTKPTYGIHGTPTPSQLFVNQSYGCVRLTNWDAAELAHLVKVNVTTVEFLDPGVTIADVTDPVAPAVSIAGSGAAAPPAVVQPTSSTDPLAAAIEAAISSTPNGGVAGSAPAAGGVPGTGAELAPAAEPVPAAAPMETSRRPIPTRRAPQPASAQGN